MSKQKGRQKRKKRFKKMSRQVTDWKKYSQYTHLTTDLYPEYIEFYKPTIKR